MEWPCAQKLLHEEKACPKCQAVNIFASGDRDKVRGPFDLNTILVINETYVGKWGLIFAREHKLLTNDIVDGFGNVFVRT